MNWPNAADCAASCGGAPVPTAGAGRKVEDLADALGMINATLVNLESRPALKGALSDDELGNLRNASAFLAEHVPRLCEIIRKTAAEVDPECPDVDAYVDGHCSLEESTKGLIDRLKGARS
jgi:hypothetical protein